MSVHILSDNHLSAVLRFAFAKTWNDTIDRDVTVRMVQDMANELALTNDRSYAARYPNEPVSGFDAPVVNWKQPLVSPLAFLKLLQNVEHQLDECPDFKNTEAAQFIRNQRFVAISKLDGYNELPWEID